MAIDAGIGLTDILGSLFFPAAEAAPAALDAGVIGAELGGEATLGVLPGAIDAGVTGGALGATVPALTDLGTGALAGGLAAGTIADTLGSAIDTGATAGLTGDVVGANNALEFAPTVANTDAAAAAAPATGAAPAATGSAAGAAPTGQIGSLTSELAGQNPNIAANLGQGTDLLSSAPTTTAQTIDTTAANVANAAAPTTNLGSANAAAVNDPAGQLAGEGGLSTDTQVALAQAGGANAAAPPGVFDQIGNAVGGLGSVTSSPAFKLAELGVPAAFLGYNLLKGPPGIPPQAQEAVQQAQATDPNLINQATQNVPLYNQTAANDLNLANNFQISPAQAASLNIFKQDAYNQLLQQIANEGITNPMSSSQWVQGKNQIDQQVLAQQVQMINQLISTAFQASQAANAGVSTAGNINAQFNSTLMQAAQLQVQQDQAFQQAVGSALTSFGLLAGLSSMKSGNQLVA